MRIAFVHPPGNIDSVPSLTNAATELAAAGFGVDFFTRADPGFEPARFEDPQISVRNSPIEGALRALVARARPSRGSNSHASSGTKPSGFRSAVRSRLHSLARLAIHLERERNIHARHREEPYVCFIGVDPEGLVLAAELVKRTGVPVAYYSLELLLSKEATEPASRVLKLREIELSRASPFIITQDSQRARLIAEDNGLPLDRFIHVPNAPLGEAERAPTKYWHERFSLDSHARVVLCAGGVGGWTGLDQIVESVPTWPPEWVLVVHTRYDASVMGEELTRLQRIAAPRRVYFSTKPVSRQEYEHLIRGAHVGISFYVPVPGSTYTQTNLEVMGLSSGKFAYYLKASLPVITNTASTLGEFVRHEGCGVVVEEAAGISEALGRIEKEYESMSARACDSFNTHMDFSRAFRVVVDRIHALPQASR